MRLVQQAVPDGTHFQHADNPVWLKYPVSRVAVHVDSLVWQAEDLPVQYVNLPADQSVQEPKARLEFVLFEHFALKTPLLAQHDQ